MLWHFAAEFALDGDLGKFSEEVIAQALSYDDPSTVLINALVESRWLDRCRCHGLRIHDWPDHADQTVQRVLAKRNQRFLECYDDPSTVLASSKMPLPKANTNTSTVSDPTDPHSSSLRSEEIHVPNSSPSFDKDPTLSLSPTDMLLLETEEDKKVKRYEYPADFDKFWRLYPNHRGGKKAALEKWKRAKKAPQWPGLEAVLDAVEAQKNSQNWRQNNGQYIPMAQTWLNQGRWDAEERRRGAGYHEVLDKIERGEL